MSSVLTVAVVAFSGALGGSLVTWVGLRRSRQIRVKRLVSHLNATNKDLAELRERVMRIEYYLHDPKQFQKRILQGITEVAHRLASLDLNVSDSVASDLPSSPFPGD